MSISIISLISGRNLSLARHFFFLEQTRKEHFSAFQSIFSIKISRKSYSSSFFIFFMHFHVCLSRTVKHQMATIFYEQFEWNTFHGKKMGVEWEGGGRVSLHCCSWRILLLNDALPKRCNFVMEPHLK